MGPIIKNPDPLFSGYVPSVILHREKQIEETCRHLSSAINNPPHHVLITGPVGAGKTLVLQSSVEKLKDSARDSGVIVYAEAWSSATGTLAEIAKAAGCKIFHYGLGRAWERFSNYLGERTFAVAMDNADMVLRRKKDRELLRLLTNRPHTSVILCSEYNLSEIAKDPYIVSKLKASHVINFPPYTKPELVDILAQRAELALFEGTYDSSILSLCADYVIQSRFGGNAEVALGLLFLAAQNAERHGSSRITEGDFSDWYRYWKVGLKEPNSQDAR
jgi:cell division control protein 6